MIGEFLCTEKALIDLLAEAREELGSLPMNSREYLNRKLEIAGMEAFRRDLEWLRIKGELEAVP